MIKVGKDISKKNLEFIPSYTVMTQMDGLKHVA